MTRVYIAETTYHLFISIVKTLLEKRIGQDVLIIVYTGHMLPVFIERCKRIFKEVLYGEGLSYSIDKLLPLLDLKIRSGKLSFLSKYLNPRHIPGEAWFRGKEIFIFNDDHYYGCLFNYWHMDYNLIEDGLNCLRWDPATLECKDRDWIYSVLGLSWECLGRSKFTKSIEVNDASIIYVKHPTVIEVNREQLFRRLDERSIDTIAWVFDYQPLHSPAEADASLLLTEPLSEDGIVSHSSKIEMHKYLVDKYAIGRLYVKAHPRDRDEYSKIFPNAIVLGNKKIPFEVYLLKEKFHFKRVITPCTTAIDAVFCADEKIQMGLEWVKHFSEHRTD